MGKKTRRICHMHSPALALTLAAVLHAHAARAAPPPDQDRLMDLARQFVATVGAKLDDIDTQLAEKISPQDLRRQKHFDSLPDGEPLILQIALARPEKRPGQLHRMNIESPVISVKEGHDVMISLLDFVTAAGFAIKVMPEENRAEGWFIRENQTFALDMTARTVTIGGTVIPVTDQDARNDGGDILVKGRTLSRWFGFQMIVDPQAQRLDITATQPWPVQERLDRMQRFLGKQQKQPPKNPLVEEEYALFSPPAANVTLNRTYSRDGPSGVARHRTSWNTTGTGDLLAHSSQFSMGGDAETPLNSIRLTLSRQAEDPVLLGPLKARYYEFNDIRTVSVANTGGSPMERGIRVTNKDPSGTYDTATSFSGYAPPGWDVELFRGLQYISGKTVGDDGTYSFANVPLYAGENAFRIVQYGPQGEIREEDRTMSVNPAAFGTGAYNVSLSQQRLHTYDATKSVSIDAGTPHLSATYEKQISDTVALRGGVRARQQAGHEIAYFHGGAVSFADKTVYNTDAIFTTDGTWMAQLTARRNFDRHSGALIGQYWGEDYATDSAVGRAIPSRLSLRGSLSGPLIDNDFRHVEYEASSGLTQRSDGFLGLNSSLELSTRIADIAASNRLSFQQSTYGGAKPDTTEVEGSLSLRGRGKGMSWRSTSTYGVVPAMELRDLRLDISRDFADNLQADFGLRRNMIRGYMVGDAALSWTHERAIISPSVSYDSDRTISAMMNVRFGLTYNPYTHDLTMSGTMAGNAGGVAAFVFLDKDGDGIFSQDDEPLPDVVIRAAHAGRTATTGADGEAFLNNLPLHRQTDIIVEENSTFDPNWVSGFPGISVRPRAAQVSRVEFPVLRGAEIDGTAYIVDDTGRKTEARNIRLSLVAPDGKVEKTTDTPYDGFYFIGGIRPGVYYLTADTAESPVAASMPPRKVVVSPEGGIIYGQDLTMTKGPDVPFLFRSGNAAPVGKNGARAVRPSDIVSQETFIRLGPYNSRLSMMLAWYKFRLGVRPWGRHFSPVTPVEDIVADEKTGNMVLVLRPASPLSLEQAAFVCRDIALQKLSCAVETVSQYAEGIIEAEAIDKTEKSNKS